jgi:hypothetical protein
MPALIRYMIANFTAGFLLGAVAALALMLTRQSPPPSHEPLAIWLQVFALAAPFGLGFLGTALFFDAEN